MNKYLTAFILLVLSLSIQSQERTVGLIDKSDDFTDQVYYTFSPVNGKSTYLVDNCGNLINQWDSEYFPGMTDYLDEFGNLYTARRGAVNPRMGSAGQGGIFQKFSWDGDLLWEYEVSDSFTLAHHDFTIKPNGNLLIIAWDYRSDAEAIQAGRNPANVNESIWSEKIMEVKPIGEDTAELVWEWYLWNHLIQDFDATKDNFGNPNLYKGKMNINNVGTVARSWMHYNSIQYNENLEQILLSSPSANEIFIIDNSTTIEEAATESGGRWNKGGEFLFRFGTNATYTSSDTVQQFYFQHNAQWIENTLEGVPGITVFNNGRYRPLPFPQKPFSNVVKIIPTIDPVDFSYVEEANAFKLDTYEVLYNQESDTSFYAAVMSGATLLEDGLFIAHAPQGRFFEINSEGEKRMEYIVPIDRNGVAIAQGTDISSFAGPLFNDNGNFKTVRYSANFIGFEGKDMTPIGTVETDPLPGLCDTVEITSIKNNLLDGIAVYPTIIVNNSFTIYNKLPAQEVLLSIFNIHGQLNHRTNINLSESNFVELPATISPGIYLVNLQVNVNNRVEIHTTKIVVL
jgi:hypothetical protein